MILFNYLNTITLTINEILNSVLFILSNYLFFEGIAIISIIWLASGSKAAKILDVGSKVIGSAAGSTFLYNYWVKGSSSNPNNEDKDKKDDKKGKNKQTTNDQITNKK